jgi:hypothetical protein
MKGAISMNTLLVGYDLDRPGQDYEPVWDKLKSYGTWWHHLDSTWLVKTALSAKEMRDEVNALIDTNDELLVIDVTGDGAAWSGFNAKPSAWLKDNL